MQVHCDPLEIRGQLLQTSACSPPREGLGIKLPSCWTPSNLFTLFYIWIIYLIFSKFFGSHGCFYNIATRCP